MNRSGGDERDLNQGWLGLLGLIGLSGLMRRDRADERNHHGLGATTR
jgi:MYXO-CTERM domain-containing protein